MNESNPTSQADGDSIDDGELDRLLTMARWPTIDERAMSRLRTSVRATSADISIRSRRVAWLVPTFAAAAGIALVCVGWYAVVHRNDSAADRLPVVVAVKPTVKAIQPMTLDRPANLYERLVIASALPSRAKPNRSPATAPHERSRVAVDPAVAFAASAHSSDWPTLRHSLVVPSDRRSIYAALLVRANQPSDADAIDLLMRLVLDPATRPGALNAFRASPTPPIDALLARLNASSMEQRFAAAKALGSLCNNRALDRLSEMAVKDDHRREALAALLSCDGPNGRAIIARLSQSDHAIAIHIAAVRGELQSLFS